MIAWSSTRFAKLNETTNCHKRSRIFLQCMFLRGFLLKFRKWKLIRESTSVTMYKNKLFFKTMFIFKTSVIDINESLCYGVWFWSDATLNAKFIRTITSEENISRSRVCWNQDAIFHNKEIIFGNIYDCSYTISHN